MTSMSTSDWNRLVATFCPQVFLCTVDGSIDDHKVDPYWPSTIDYYLSNSFLICQENRFTNPTESLLGQCPDSNSYLVAAKDSYDGQHSATAPASQGSETQVLTAPIHVHIRNASGGSPGPGEIDIQYWFFYPYNGKVDFATGTSTGLGEHQGDWEHVTVRLNKDWRTAPTLKEVYYAAHANEGSWNDDPPLYGGTHPIAYSAWHSHASYPTTGVHHRAVVLADYTSAGWQWGPEFYESATGQVSVAQIAAIDSGVYETGDDQIPDAPWIAFKGRWGDTGTSSPPNPPVQGYWTSDPSA